MYYLGLRILFCYAGDYEGIIQSKLKIPFQARFKVLRYYSLDPSAYIFTYTSYINDDDNVPTQLLNVIYIEDHLMLEYQPSLPFTHSFINLDRNYSYGRYYDLDDRYFRT